jgi:hypothetical protein
MTNRQIKIERYVPNQELVFEVLNHRESVRYSGLIYGSIVFLALLFSMVFRSPLLVLFVATFLGFFIKYQPNPFLKRAVFNSKTLILLYKMPLIEWTKTYKLDSGIDWFVDLNKKPIEIQIGTNNKILFDFQLENEHELPPLTDKISALTKMSFDENQRADNYEVLRFRPQNQLPSGSEFYFIKIEKNQHEIRVIVGTTKPFRIDLRNEVLHYNTWFSEKSIPLKQIEKIFYKIPSKKHSDLFVKWYFFDKQIQDDVLFFSLDVVQIQNVDNGMDTDYRALNFKSDMDNLKSLLKEIPALANVEIEGT